MKQKQKRQNRPQRLLSMIKSKKNFFPIALLIFSIGVVGILNLLLDSTEPDQVSAAGTVFTVTSLDDSGTGTLQEAVNLANINPGLDTIVFDVSGEIISNNTLTQIEITDPVIINAFDDTDDPQCSKDDQPQVTLKKISLATPSSSSNDINGTVIAGLNFQDVGQAIKLWNAQGVTIKCNYIGTEIDGESIATSPTVTQDSGIFFINFFSSNQAADNLIEENIIGGQQYGIRTQSSAINGASLRVKSNMIGANKDGDTALSNVVGLNISSPNTVIGGSRESEGNVISGNKQTGINLVNHVDNTVIAGNFIGTDSDGLSALSNGFDPVFSGGPVVSGISIWLGSNNANDGVFDMTIGGNSLQKGNVISGNEGDGVGLKGGTNLIQNFQIASNYVGVGSDGETIIANLGNGLNLTSSNFAERDFTGSVVEKNVVGGNQLNGIMAREVHSLIIKSNYIGTNSQYLDLGNNADGMLVWGSNNMIGEATITGSNIIGYNGESGINVGPYNSGVSGTFPDDGKPNVIHNNYIGTSPDETQDIGNIEAGISIVSYNVQQDEIGGVRIPNTVVGGYNELESNVIANNEAQGVRHVYGLNGSILKNKIYNNDLLDVDVWNSFDGFPSNGYLLVDDTEEVFIKLVEDSNDNREYSSVVDQKRLIPHPIVNDINYTEDGVEVSISFSSFLPNRNFRFDLYSNNLGSTIHGEKEMNEYLESINIITDADGKSNWNVVLPIDYKNKYFVPVATIFGSETIGNPYEGVYYSSSSEGGCSLVVQNDLEYGPGSLKDAIACANLSEAQSTIVFNIDEDLYSTNIPWTIETLAGQTLQSSIIINGVDKSANPVCDDKFVPKYSIIGSNNIQHGVVFGPARYSNTEIYNNVRLGVYGLNFQGFRNDSGDSKAISFIHRNSTFDLFESVNCSTIGTSKDGHFATLDTANDIGINIQSQTASVFNSIISNNHYGVVIDHQNEIRNPLPQNTPLQNLIQGNYIGVNRQGENMANIADGVRISGNVDHKTVIGGLLPENQNNIAYNNGFGVHIAGDATGVSILRNSMFKNQNLGINLSGGTEDTNGITANDQGDGDTGANNLQNYPVIDAPNISGTTVTGTLNSEPNKNYRLELYANANNFDVASDREGAEFLQAFDVTTDSNGDATWSTTIDAGDVGKALTLNATEYTVIDPQNPPTTYEGTLIGDRIYTNTSEFGGIEGDGSEPPDPDPLTPGVGITKEHNQTQDNPQPGDTITYTLTYQNDGEVELTNTEVADTLDPNLVYTDNSCTNALPADVTCTFTPDNTGTTGGLLTWNPGNLPVNTDPQNPTIYSVSFEVTISPNTEESITSIFNEAFINTSEINGETGDVPVTIDHPAPPDPDVPSVEIDKTHDKTGEGVQLEEVLTYTITYENDGAVELTNVAVTDTLDPNLEYVDNSCSNALPSSDPQGSPSGTPCSFTPDNTGTTGGLLTWNPGNLPAGTDPQNPTVYSVSFQVTLSPDIDSGATTAANTAFINTAQVTGQITAPPVEIDHPDLTIAKEHDKENGAQPGDTVTYIISYENTGAVDLTDAVLTDTLDPNLLYIENSCTNSCTFTPDTDPNDANGETGGLLTWNLGTLLQNGGSLTQTFQVTLNPNLGVDTTSIGNTAFLNTTELDGQTSTIGLSIVYDSEIENTPSKEEIKAGEEVDFTITFENTSNTTLTNVVITDTLNPELEFISCTDNCTVETVTSDAGTQTNGDENTFLGTTLESLGGIEAQAQSQELTRLTWTYDSLDINQEQTVSFKAALKDTSLTSITNTALMTSNEIQDPKAGEATVRIEQPESQTEEPVSVPLGNLPNTGGGSWITLIIMIAIVAAGVFVGVKRGRGLSFHK